MEKVAAEKATVEKAAAEIAAAEKAEVRDCYAVLETPRPVQRMHPRPTLW